MNAHSVTREFESALCAYTGAPFAVAVNSCTMALLLSLAWNFWGRLDCVGYPMHYYPERETEIPKRTYVSVAMAIIQAGGWPTFRDEEWRGAYQLKPFPVWDSARRFTSGMYVHGTFTCVSFHASKILGDSQGGAILHDDPQADAWLRRARFDGRTEGLSPKDDTFTQIGWHCYLSPDVAARLLWKLSVLPLHNEPLPNDPYPDLSTMSIFK